MDGRRGGTNGSDGTRLSSGWEPVIAQQGLSFVGFPHSCPSLLLSWSLHAPYISHTLTPPVPPRPLSAVPVNARTETHRLLSGWLQNLHSPQYAW